MKIDDSLRAAACDSVTGTLGKPRCRHVIARPVVGPFRGSSSRQKGAGLLQRMVARATVCVRRLAHGQRAQEVGFGRFLANRRVTTDRLVEGWSDQTASAVAGRHILAIQDTTEINFRTRPKRRRGLGKIDKGGGRGLLLHGMLAIDANTGSCLGLVGGRVWTRRGTVKVAHQKRPSGKKESHRWPDTAEQGKRVLSAATMVTVLS